MLWFILILSRCVFTGAHGVDVFDLLMLQLTVGVCGACALGDADSSYA